jgi:murein DD-endopeptidase MepM/ murein hydrolase activator NlpD
MPGVGVGAEDAAKGNSDMPESLVERVWAWLHETFPERQIYIRSDGRVQFFTFGPSLQATIAGLSLIFLGWVAFATVNVVFKDRIIAAKDHRYQEMQSAYENRVADLQSSYDELNGALVSAEDRFKETADELQTKQNTIMKFINRKGQVDQTLASLAAGQPSTAPAPNSAPNIVPNNGVPTVLPAQGGDADSDSDEVQPQMTIAPGAQAPAQQQQHVNKRASFLDIGGAMGRIRGLLFGNGSNQTQDAISPAMLARHPALKVLGIETGRVASIGVSETALLSGTEQRLAERVTTLQDIIRRTGIDPQQYARKFADAEGIGGPDIPLQSVQIEGISDNTFKNAYLNAAAVLEQMNGIFASLRHIPLTTPVHGDQFNRTSGFGPRIDPFTGRASFHPGLDFAGPWGAPIAATAPGTVVWAGPKGGYGNLVEIDHGYGIHTRYGHLSAILVRVGARVSQGAPIGRLGSTGRSTGPHVHYEVWYDDVVRNPSNFIEAGRHVLQ